MKKFLISATVLIVTFLMVAPDARAHRSGCHKEHSCPSDTGSYVCGDLGNDSQCPGKETNTKAAKVCVKDKKKLDKETAKLLKESKRENLSNKSLKKQQAKEKAHQAKILKYEARCGSVDAGTIGITDTVIGTGAEAKAGSRLTVKYVGMLHDGIVFDASSKHQPEGFTFTLGVGQVIKGWDLGVSGMKVGGKRRLVIPSYLAYGSQRIGDIIPPNSTLTFDIELVRIN